MYYGAGLSGRALVLMWTAADLHGFLSDRMDPGTGSADLKLGIVKTLSCVFGDLITKARGRLDMTDRFCSDPTLPHKITFFLHKGRQNLMCHMRRISRRPRICHKQLFTKFGNLLLIQQLTKMEQFYKGVWGIAIPFYLLAVADCSWCGCWCRCWKFAAVQNILKWL